MKRFLILVILFAVLLVSCAPPTDSLTYTSSSTQTPEQKSEFNFLYVGRAVDLEFGYVCYYHKYDGGIWCDKLEK